MRTDNFAIIREILAAIEAQMDERKTDWSKFSAAALSVSEPRWEKLMVMLSEDGLIKGFNYGTHEGAAKNYTIHDIRLSLAGLKYLSESK